MFRFVAEHLTLAEPKVTRSAVTSAGVRAITAISSSARSFCDVTSSRTSNFTLFMVSNAAKFTATSSQSGLFDESRLDANDGTPF